MNAESELEAVGMAWGAAATGTPAATGSTGQGLSLMQESLAEITLARLPLVVLNMARAQGDYFQATRGGGHGDYRHLVLAPCDVPEAVELVAAGRSTWPHAGATRCWCSATTTWPTPPVGRRSTPSTSAAHRPPDWALDGSTGGSGHAKLVSPLGRRSSATMSGYDLSVHYRARAAATAEMLAGVAPLAESASPTTPRWSSWPSAPRALRPRRRCSELRAEGRPGRLCPPDHAVCPFPGRPIAAGRDGARAVAVYENNQGQMIDDVRLAVLGRAPVDLHRRVEPGRLRLRHRPRSRRRRAADRIAQVLPTRRTLRRSDDERRRARGARSDRPPPTAPATLVDDFTPGADRRRATHHLCPGCGEPIAMRSIVEVDRRARRSPNGRSPCSASAATPRSRTTSMSRCCRRSTAGRPRWPPA